MLNSIYQLAIFICIIASIVKGSFLEALILLFIGIVYSVHQLDLPKRMLFGARAGFVGQPPNNLNNVDRFELNRVVGSYYLSLFFYGFISLLSLFIFRHFWATILCIAQIVLLTEQFRDKPEKFVVVFSNTLPGLIYFLLIPDAMNLAKIISISCALLLFFQGILLTFDKSR